MGVLHAPLIFTKKKELVMRKEYWRPVVGYEGLYMVSNLGRVKSLNYKNTGKEQILRQFIVSKHICVNICSDLKYVHILVAQAFIPNPENKPEVHHIDKNPLNNCVDNLMWVTKEEHAALHSERYNKLSELFTNGSCSTPIEQYSLDKELIKTWPSLSEIHRQLGYDIRLISRVCSEEPKYKKNKTAYGSIWRYASLLV